MDLEKLAIGVWVRRQCTALTTISFHVSFFFHSPWFYFFLFSLSLNCPLMDNTWLRSDPVAGRNAAAVTFVGLPVAFFCLFFWMIWWRNCGMIPSWTNRGLLRPDVASRTMVMNSILDFLYFHFSSFNLKRKVLVVLEDGRRSRRSNTHA
jgi:hypothetical protein